MHPLSWVQYIPTHACIPIWGYLIEYLLEMILTSCVTGTPRYTSRTTAYAMQLYSKPQLSILPLHTSEFVYSSVQEIVTHQQRSTCRPGPFMDRPP